MGLCNATEYGKGHVVNLSSQKVYFMTRKYAECEGRLLHPNEHLKFTKILCNGIVDEDYHMNYIKTMRDIDIKLYHKTYGTEIIKIDRLRVVIRHEHEECGDISIKITDI